MFRHRNGREEEREGERVRKRRKEEKEREKEREKLFLNKETGSLLNIRIPHIHFPQNSDSIGYSVASRLVPPLKNSTLVHRFYNWFYNFTRVHLGIEYLG